MKLISASIELRIHLNGEERDRTVPFTIAPAGIRATLLYGENERHVADMAEAIQRAVRPFFDPDEDMLELTEEMQVEQEQERYYAGKRVGNIARVGIIGAGGVLNNLDARFDLMNHSPDGFEWGYGGSGPAQLALAILADATDDEFAIGHYQNFKFNYVARLARGSEWAISRSDVRKIAGYGPAEAISVASEG